MTSPTMKRLLVSAAAAPLCLAAMQTAQAQVTISGSQSTPLLTSTANGGQASDVQLTGSVSVSSGVAVTVDTNNNLTNSGTIASTASSGSTGVLIKGGLTTTFSNTGTIAVDNSATLNDTNGDGYADSPFTSESNKYGVHVLAGTMTGSYSDSGTLTVIGNNSYGVAVDGTLNGAFSHSGTLSVTGDNSYGIWINNISGQTGTVGNGFSASGTISVNGTNSTAIDLHGNVDGQVSISGTVSSTGYSSTTVPYTYQPTTDGSSNGGLISSDFGAGGPAVRIEGNVGLNPGSTGSGGIVLSSGSSVISYGPGVALGIGPTSGASEIGIVSSATPYGLVLSGTLEGDVLYAANQNAQALQIGGYGGTVTVDGGVLNSGTVAAITYIANANAVLIGSGATIPTLVNSGTIGAQVYSQGTNTATAILINQGGSLTSINNTGVIQATVSGLSTQKTAVQGSAYAIVDKSGSLTSITNSGTIGASVVVGNTDSTVASTVKRVAIDVSANTTGVTIQQNAASSGTASITGDVLFGNGNNTLDLESGTLTGAVSFGTGSDTLTLANGATEVGALSKSGGSLGVSLSGNSLLHITNAQTFNVSSLVVGSGSQIMFAADSANNTATLFNVTGTATLASGAKIGLDFASKLDANATATYTVIDASHATNATIGQLSLGNVSWFYNATLNPVTDNTVTLTVNRKTAAQAGVTLGANAYDAIYATFDKDANIRNTFLSATTAASFQAAYQQMLPEYSGGVFQGLALGARTIAHAASEAPIGVADTGRRVWIQQLGWGNISEQRNAPSYRDDGYALAAGWEKAFDKLGTIGVSTSYMMFNVDEPDRQNGDHVAGSGATGGFYWRDHLGYFKADASVTGGYVWMHSTRSFVGTDSSGNAFTDQAVSNWNGYFGLAHAGLGWERLLISNLFIRPAVEADYFYLSEEAHKETQGNQAFNLALAQRTGNQGSGTASMTFGLRPMTGINGFVWQPELTVGYRELFGQGAGDTVASFLSGGPSFSLSPEHLKSGGPTATLAIHGGNRYSDIALEGTGEERGGYTSYQGRFVFRFRF